MSAAVAAESPANRAIEVREGGLPLRVGSQGELVAHVQTKLGVASDGIFGPQTDAAVRKYQLSAGLEVDGIVGLATWSSLFEQASASGASMGGSNVPPQVKEKVAQTLQQAGDELAVQGDTGAGTTVGGQVNATPPSSTTPTSQPNTTLATTPVSGSCSSATISAPVKGTVTSPYGPRGGRNHDGMDIAAPTGTPVRAAACGTVSLAGQQSGYGNIVCITHTSQFSTCYAHLSRFGTTNGAQVQQGQVIGYVGCTGSCTGPHVHFETRVNGQAQNPSTYLSGGSSIPGKRATVAGTSSTGTKASSTVTASAQPAGEQVLAEPTAVGEAQVAAPGEVTTTESTTEATTAPAPVPAEAAPTATVATEVAAEPVAAEAEAAAPAEVAAEPVAVEAEVAAPAEVAAEPVATETQAAAPAEVAAEPVATETQAAAPTEVAPEPVAVEAQVAAPVEPVAAEAQVAAEPVAAEAAPAPDAGADQAQADVAATAAVQ